jgi:hypothetical protein
VKSLKLAFELVEEVLSITGEPIDDKLDPGIDENGPQESP